MDARRLSERWMRLPGSGDRETCNSQKDKLLKPTRAVRPDGCSGAHSAQNEHPTAVLARPFSSRTEPSASTRQRQKHAPDDTEFCYTLHLRAQRGAVRCDQSRRDTTSERMNTKRRHVARLKRDCCLSGALLIVRSRRNHDERRPAAHAPYAPALVRFARLCQVSKLDD